MTDNQPQTNVAAPQDKGPGSLQLHIAGALISAGFLIIGFIMFDHWTNGGTGGNGSIMPWAFGFLILGALLVRSVRGIFFILRSQKD